MQKDDKEREEKSEDKAREVTKRRDSVRAEKPKETDEKPTKKQAR